MLKKFNWQAYTNRDRLQIIEQTKEIIALNDGYIINFNMFSDLAINISIGIEERRVDDLYDALSNIIVLSEFDAQEGVRNSIRECLILINISFSHGKGELKKDIPAVPG